MDKKTYQCQRCGDPDVMMITDHIPLDLHYLGISDDDPLQLRDIVNFPKPIIAKVILCEECALFLSDLPRNRIPQSIIEK